MCMEDVRLARETVVNNVFYASVGIGTFTGVGVDPNRLAITVSHSSADNVWLQSVRNHGGGRITLQITPTFATRTYTIDELGDAITDAWNVITFSGASFINIIEVRLGKQ